MTPRDTNLRNNFMSPPERRHLETQLQKIFSGREKNTHTPRKKCGRVNTTAKHCGNRKSCSKKVWKKMWKNNDDKTLFCNCLPVESRTIIKNKSVEKIVDGVRTE